MADDASTGSEIEEQEAAKSVSKESLESESEESWDEGETFKTERVVEFILNAGENETLQTPPNYSAEISHDKCIGGTRKNRPDFRKRCLKKLHLNTQTGMPYALECTLNIDTITWEN